MEFYKISTCCMRDEALAGLSFINHWKHLWPWRLTIVLLAYHKMQEQMAFTATWLGIKESLSHSAKDWLHDTVLHICCHRVSYWLAWAVWSTSYMRHTKKCKWHFSWYNSYYGTNTVIAASEVRPQGWRRTWDGQKSRTPPSMWCYQSVETSYQGNDTI